MERPKRRFARFSMLAALVFTAACGSAQGTDVTEPGGERASQGEVETTVVADPEPSVAELVALAAEAWVYGYPAVYQREEMVRATSSEELSFSAPLNLTGSARALATERDQFVSVNNDTAYHMVQADVADEPLVLNVPATGDRYVVLQFVDAWTNNFAYLGTRGTEGRAGKYLLAGPGFDGEVPEELTLIRSPTRHFTIVGRIAVNGPSDMRAVSRIQRQAWVTPLSVYPEQPNRAERELGDRDFAPYDQEVSEDLIFWEKLRSWIALNPPPASEQSYLARFEVLGLLDGGAASPYRAPSEELRQALVGGREAAAARLEETITAGDGADDAGWTRSTHMFDYNVDHFGIGTVDSDEWKIADRQRAYVVRTIAARVGLWGQHGYEAVYAPNYLDADGEPLSGEHRYELTFPTPPPVDAFWSVTMYDHPNYWLVGNSIDRFSIGDRTRGLRRGSDGSITIYISHEPPPRAQRSNWLPAPEGRFRPILRMYLPQAPITDGSYVLPPIRRVDGDEAAE